MRATYTCRLVGALGLTGLMGLLGVAEPPPARDYAVVVSQETFANPDWRQVVEILAAKHPAETIVFEGDVGSALGRLRECFPRYVGFVARPEEATRGFVTAVHRLTRQLDEDPYTDCFWGILTGYDAANAQRIARHAEPLIIRKVAAGTEIALEPAVEGVWYSELEKNRRVRKEPGQAPVEHPGPDDTTGALVEVLNTYQPDLFVTSGHATEREWIIGYRYRSGLFRCAAGQLYGLDTRDQKHPIASPNPKVYLPVGNCLMGHIDRPDCMALAWMNSAGVRQMFGYTVPTWFGYMGWGVLDYFVEQPGRYTLTEAFFANHHALVHRLAIHFPDLLEAETDPNGRLSSRPTLNDKARAAGLAALDARGLVFDRDAVAFYGDPKWPARMAAGSRPFEQVLREDNGVFTFEVIPNRGRDSFRTVNTNGSQRGGRPFIAFFPYRVGPAEVIQGADLEPLISDDFILVPRPPSGEPDRSYRVVFKASRID